MKYALALTAVLLAAPAARAGDPSEPGLGDQIADVYRGTVQAIAELVPAPVPDITMLTTQPIPLVLSSGYGWREDPIRHRRQFHSGTDFPASFGTPVLAAGPGTVIFAGRLGGYGNCVQIDHGGGVVTLYGHMRKIETKKGAIVAAGDRIGQVGATGRATGPHLHFEIRLDKHPVDPVAAMAIAQEWRDSPIGGRIAAYQLTPDRQKTLRAYSDRLDGPHAHASHPEHSSRPGRPGHEKRPQVLW